MKFWDKRAHASCNIQLNYDGLLLSTLNLLIFDILSKCDLLFIICLFHSINNLFKREINLIRLIIHSAFFRFPYFLFQELVAISFAFSKNQFISFLLLSVIFFLLLYSFSLEDLFAIQLSQSSPAGPSLFLSSVTLFLVLFSGIWLSSTKPICSVALYPVSFRVSYAEIFFLVLVPSHHSLFIQCRCYCTRS